MSDKERLEALARMIAVELGKAPKKPELSVVGQAKPQHEHSRRLDQVTRESYLQMIRNLRRAYAKLGMDLIVNQALVGKGRLENLDDDDLVKLLSDMHRARECIMDDVGFDHAQLIRAY